MTGVSTCSGDKNIIILKNICVTSGKLGRQEKSITSTSGTNISTTLTTVCRTESEPGKVITVMAGHYARERDGGAQAWGNDFLMIVYLRKKFL